MSSKVANENQLLSITNYSKHTDLKSSKEKDHNIKPKGTELSTSTKNFTARTETSKENYETGKIAKKILAKEEDENEEEVEIDRIRTLYKKTLSQDPAPKKTMVITSNNTSYLVVVKEGLFKRELHTIVKVNFQSLQSKTPLYDSSDFLAQGGLKTAYRGRDVKNNNAAVVIALFNKKSRDLGIEEALELSKQFKDSKYFAFGTLIRFDVKNKEGNDSPREAYLTPEKKFGDFRQYLDKRPFLTEYKLAKILLPAAKGIELMHQKGIVHCDLKPENLLVDEEGAKVGDPDTLTKGKKLMNFSGTAPYMAPEYIRNLEPHEENGGVKVALISSDASFKIDVFSWGAILYRALNKKDLVDYILEKVDVDEWEGWSWNEAIGHTISFSESIPKECEKLEKKETSQVSLAFSHPVSFHDKLIYFKKLTLEEKAKYLNQISADDQKKLLSKLPKPERSEIRLKRGEIAKTNCEILKKQLQLAYGEVFKAHDFLIENYETLKPESDNLLEMLAWKCVHPDPLKRPTMKDIVLCLNNLS